MLYTMFIYKCGHVTMVRQIEVEGKFKPDRKIPKSIESDNAEVKKWKKRSEEDDVFVGP